VSDQLVLFLAQGFGIGRIRWAPGTWGSVLGLGWFALLLAYANFWIFVFGTVLGFAVSVWICGRAEKILNETDPSSVVLDEVTAIPACFAAWIGVLYFQTGWFPTWSHFFREENLYQTLGIFIAFRCFDILKPWPVRQSQRLPGGWGVTVDDFLAAIYVNVCFGAYICLQKYLRGY
jgi:phosphatidylglycerophosphatase A